MTNFYLQTPSTFCAFNASHDNQYGGRTEVKVGYVLVSFRWAKESFLPTEPLPDAFSKEDKNEDDTENVLSKKGQVLQIKTGRGKEQPRCIRGMIRLNKKQKTSFLWFSQFPHAAESLFRQLQKPGWYRLWHNHYGPNGNLELPNLKKPSFQFRFFLWIHFPGFTYPLI